jgi:hypothetical protein
MLAGPVRAEVGYLNQYGLRPGRTDSMDQVFSIAIGADF